MNITYRKATLLDIELLIKLRLDFTNDEGVDMTSDEMDDFVLKL